jgi:hypothetical protein
MATTEIPRVNLEDKLKEVLDDVFTEIKNQHSTFNLHLDRWTIEEDKIILEFK